MAAGKPYPPKYPEERMGYPPNYPVEEMEPEFMRMGKPKQRRVRKPTLKSVARQAKAAGIEVDHFEYGVDGRIIVVPANSAQTILKTNGHIKEVNEWDEVFDGKH